VTENLILQQQDYWKKLLGPVIKENRPIVLDETEVMLGREATVPSATEGSTALTENMNIQVNRRDKRIVMTCDGKLDHSTVVLLEETIGSVIKENTPIFLDLAKVNQYIA